MILYINIYKIKNVKVAPIHVVKMTSTETNLLNLYDIIMDKIH